MANRRFNQFQLSLERALVTLYADVVAAGASITSSTDKGFIVTRTGVGAYTLTFRHLAGTAVVADLYNSLKSIDCMDDSGEICKVQVVADNIATTGIVTVLLLDFAGAATDQTGSQWWTVVTKNTSTEV